MSSKRLSLLLCVVVGLTTAGGSAHAVSWWEQLWKPRATPGRTKHELENARTLRLGEITGSTGASAAKALTAQLRATGEVRVIEKAARFTLSGDSVGGRLNVKLTDRAGKLIFERTYAAPGLTDNVKALTDDVLFAVTGRQGLASSQIAFVSDAPGTKQVYVCDADGGNVQQVTRHPHGAVSPALSPEFLAFTGYGTGFPCVVLVDMGAGMERQVASTPGQNSGAAFAPDGRSLALTMSFIGNPEIFVLDLPSSNAICVTESVGTPSSPSWHPMASKSSLAPTKAMDLSFMWWTSPVNPAPERWPCASLRHRSRVVAGWQASRFHHTQRHRRAVAVASYPEGDIADRAERRRAASILQPRRSQPRVCAERPALGA